MLDLFLMRHAKSSWKDPSLDDFHRPLNKRGRTAAPLMARWMKQRGIRPELALVSSAKRTRETWKLLKQERLKVNSVVTMKRLYLASSAELLQIIQGIDSEVQSLLLIGHNPGLHILLKSLLTPEPKTVDPSVFTKFPTSAFAHLTFEVTNWSDVAPMGGNLYRYMTPKRLSLQDFTLDDYIDR